jgi:hypothetical protein
MTILSLKFSMIHSKILTVAKDSAKNKTLSKEYFL